MTVFSVRACSSGLTKYEMTQVMITAKNRPSIPSDKWSEKLDELIDQ